MYVAASMTCLRALWPQLSFLLSEDDKVTKLRTRLRCTKHDGNPVFLSNAHDVANVMRIPIDDIMRCSREDLLVTQLAENIMSGEQLKPWNKDKAHSDTYNHLLERARALASTVQTLLVNTDDDDEAEVAPAAKRTKTLDSVSKPPPNG